MGVSETQIILAKDAKSMEQSCLGQVALTVTIVLIYLTVLKLKIL